MFQPIEVTDVLMAFPATVAHLIPPREEWEKSKPSREAELLYRDTFLHGPNELTLVAREGVDAPTAWRHLTCLLGTYSTKAEDKKSMCCYLIDLWFDMNKTTWKAGEGA